MENLGGKFEWKTWVEILGGTFGLTIWVGISIGNVDGICIVFIVLHYENSIDFFDGRRKRRGGRKISNFGSGERSPVYSPLLNHRQNPYSKSCLGNFHGGEIAANSSRIRIYGAR